MAANAADNPRDALPTVSARAFTAMQHLNVAQLAECTADEIRPVLPSLVRMNLLTPYDNTKTAQDMRKQILMLLVSIESVNSIVSILQLDYHELEADVKKEQQLRQKSGNAAQDAVMFHGLKKGVALGFERADPTMKVRIVLSELFYIQAQIFEQNQMQMSRGPIGANENIAKESELFDSDIYLEEITNIICIAVAELPSLFNIQEVIETLLYVNSGRTIICWVVANTPDCFKEVITALISNGDEDTAEGRLRSRALDALCDMNPGQALPTRTLCMELMRMPSLMLRLSLTDPLDLITFVSGLLLGNDVDTRNWFSQYLRNNQKQRSNAMQAVLLKQLQSIVTSAANASPSMPDEYVVQASTLLRLYCALRSIAGIKLSDDEVQLLIDLVTSKPPPSAAGISFVSLGLCMLIACPTLIALPAHEQKSIEWIQWLIKDESYFERNTSGGASFGEMLLLMAIHFHSNQVTNITELVCSTLGMKIPMRQNNLNRMKQIFTQEIFTEQAVAAHAVRVPVTVQLNANITGYLPVHCIHQLLKSRAFSKHKVPIKSWIYRQICTCTTPLHPVLPALIEAFVTATVAPQAKGPLEHTHKPLSEDEIVRVFQRSVAGSHLTSAGAKETPTDDSTQPAPSDCSQLLLLYYLLLYEDVRLSNMGPVTAAGRKIKAYSAEFLAELPIKYLLQQAQKKQHLYAGLFSPLLRLLVTHFPHLSLVEDWLDEEQASAALAVRPPSAPALRQLHSASIDAAFVGLAGNPMRVIMTLKHLLKMKPTDVWPHAETIIRHVQRILDRQVPRLVQELYKQVWIRLNTVLPRRLWTMTVNALMPDDGCAKTATLSQDAVLLDPMQVLRCDERVFRCPAVLAIVLRILQANLAASRAQLTRHMLDKPLLEKNGQQLQPDIEREELKAALCATQDSAAVQILLETCAESDEDRNVPGQLWTLREIRGMVCSYIHQVFIAEPSLARLVHFQGYARELLPVTVRGIPSMHICMDFIPELLSMPEMDKQIFAIDLTSHLGLQHALPKTMSAAKLCISTLLTLLGILSSDARVEMFRAILPCVVRFGEAFPPLLDDCVLLLMQLGRLAASQASLGRATALPALSLSPCSRVRAQTRQAQQAEQLVEEVRETFAQLLKEAVLKPKIY